MKAALVEKKERHEIHKSRMFDIPYARSRGTDYYFRVVTAFFIARNVLRDSLFNNVRAGPLHFVSVKE